MYRSILRTLFDSAQLAALVMAAGLVLAANSGQRQIADGMDIYLGVMPAEIVRGHPKAHSESAMHGGMPPSKGYHHVIVSLFDSQSGNRITDAEVTAKVEEPGHLERSEKALESMTIAGTLTYGNYFRMPGKGPYLISLEIRRPGSPRVVEAKFDYRHP